MPVQVERVNRKSATYEIDLLEMYIFIMKISVNTVIGRAILLGSSVPVSSTRYPSQGGMVLSELQR